MDYKEEYQKALERAKMILCNLPEGSSSERDIETIFPELKESEDERIRKEMIHWLKGFIGEEEGCGYNEDEIRERIAYLEKQKEPLTPEEKMNHPLYLEGFDVGKNVGEVLKEQKPAEWSEEFLRLMGITISQDGNQVCVLLGENLAEGIAGFGDTLADAVEEFKKEWRQFDRFRKATWKPSKEQISALEYFIRSWGESGTMSPQNTFLCAAKSLLNALKKL